MPGQAMRVRVDGRPGTALPFGLLNAAAIVPTADPHEENGVDWLPLGCGPADVTTWCLPDDEPDPGNEQGEDKIFARPVYLTAPPATVYAAVSCALPGLSFQEAAQQARAMLSVGEQAALERWTWQLLMAQATDVSAAGGDLSVVGRLAALEAALADVYSGVGMLHAPVGLAAYLSVHGLVQRDGARLRTLSGHLVAIGAGYPGSDLDGSAPAADELWLAISGPVTIRQGEIADVPGSQREGVATATNDVLALAERTSVVMIECGAFAAVVQKACCGTDSTPGS